jgi:LuxR family maltose regulon positive regulatory protein
VTAPAGYGKTTTLAEWDSVDPRPFAWITLDERQDDPSFLASSIATALDRIEPIGPGVFDVLGSARPGLSHALIPRLAEAINGREEPFVLVLDDLHRLDEPQSIELITALSEHLPPGSQFALAARGEPPIPVGRLRAEGRIAELGTAELALTRSETAELLEVAGVSLGRQPLGQPRAGDQAAVGVPPGPGRRQPDLRRWLGAGHGRDRI